MLVKAASDIKQTCITQFYDILNEIERLSHTNKLLSVFQQKCPDDRPFSPILKQIILNAERNATALPQVKRHTEVLKKFATALFIYAEPLAYNFLQKYLHQALPSLRTVQRIVHASYDTLNEGEFCFDGLIDHIHKPVSLVTIGEDATRIIYRVEYDVRTNQCVGFVLPLKNGLPEIDSFIAISFEAVEKMFTNQTVAKYAYVYMAQPLVQKVPPFCLACFGTDNRFSANHVLSRWQHITVECSKRNIQVVNFGGDRDARVMKAMRISNISQMDHYQ